MATKQTLTTAHYSPKRMWKYIKRNTRLVTKPVKNPQKYLHSAAKFRAIRTEVFNEYYRQVNQ